MSATVTPLLIVISAPSGAGKTTLCNGVLAGDAQVSRAITCTTRAPRLGEQPGVDYYFLSVAEFEQRAAVGEFLEHATVHGNRYGTLKVEVLNRLRAGRDVLLNIDVQGAASIRAAASREPELARALVSVFLTTPSLTELESRLRNRNQDAPEVIERRVKVARQELAEWVHFDYLILSGSKDEDLRRMQAILVAERIRQTRALPPVF
ncbi:MAG: guanylate kinase [Verrucomicrobiota bacterium]